MKQPSLVSVHGGHSGQFCNHAQDTLEELVKAYMDQGFAWVGLTEHMPPVEERFVFPEEAAAGYDARGLYARFADYIETARTLQQTYADSIRIFVGMETEMVSGYQPFIQELVAAFSPDYLVGSVHHVNDIGIDMSQADYDAAAQAAGSLDTLYCQYFDQQYEMLQALKPAVVGHFDLIRIFDPNYPHRLNPDHNEIWSRIQRNLACVRDLDLILDFNVRAWTKGASEPYISRPILEEARRLGIAVVPGDDSHSAAGVGLDVERGIAILQELDFDTDWRPPVV